MPQPDTPPEVAVKDAAAIRQIIQLPQARTTLETLREFRKNTTADSVEDRDGATIIRGPFMHNVVPRLCRALGLNFNPNITSAENEFALNDLEAALETTAFTYENETLNRSPEEAAAAQKVLAEEEEQRRAEAVAQGKRTAQESIERIKKNQPQPAPQPAETPTETRVYPPAAKKEPGVPAITTTTHLVEDALATALLAIPLAETEKNVLNQDLEKHHAALEVAQIIHRNLAIGETMTEADVFNIYTQTHTRLQEILGTNASPMLLNVLTLYGVSPTQIAKINTEISGRSPGEYLVMSFDGPDLPENIGQRQQFILDLVPRLSDGEARKTIAQAVDNLHLTNEQSEAIQKATGEEARQYLTSQLYSFLRDPQRINAAGVTPQQLAQLMIDQGIKPEQFAQAFTSLAANQQIAEAVGVAKPDIQGNFSQLMPIQAISVNRETGQVKVTQGKTAGGQAREFSLYLPGAVTGSRPTGKPAPANPNPAIITPYGLPKNLFTFGTNKAFAEINARIAILNERLPKLPLLPSNLDRVLNTQIVPAINIVRSMPNPAAGLSKVASQAAQKMVVQLATKVGAKIGATATLSALGTAIAPVVGTVVGFVVGTLIEKPLGWLLNKIKEHPWILALGFVPMIFGPSAASLGLAVLSGAGLLALAASGGLALAGFGAGLGAFFTGVMAFFVAPLIFPILLVIALFLGSWLFFVIFYEVFLIPQGFMSNLSAGQVASLYPSNPAYFTVQKSANPDTFTNDQVKPGANPPPIVTYTIHIAPSTNIELTNATITETITLIKSDQTTVQLKLPYDWSQDNGQKVPASIVAPVDITYTLSLVPPVVDIQGNPIPPASFYDSFVVNAVAVTGDARNTKTNEVANNATNTSSATITIGTPPVMDPLGWPVCGPAAHVTQGPNGSYSHANLQAVDIGVPLGTAVRPTHNGTASCGSSVYDGDYVVVSAPANYYSTLYAHLETGSRVCSGNVTRNTVIGQIVVSGLRNSGPHSHYQLNPGIGGPSKGPLINHYLTCPPGPIPPDINDTSSCPVPNRDTPACPDPLPNSSPCH
jgi:hypothetical protein